MVFSSIQFLFYFFTIFFAVYYLVPWKNAWLLVGSLGFYGWGEPRSVGLLVGFIVLNWAFGRAIGAATARRRLALTGIGVAADLGIMVWFKYANFLVAQLGAPAVGWQPIALPLGISFFVFQGISYLVDVHRGDVAAQRNLLTFAAYKSMFPQLVAGPIVRYRQVAARMVRRRVSLFRLQVGLSMFIIGLAQKTLLANTLAVPANDLFALPAGQLTAAAAWLGAVCYTLQIYFDFAGYSNMAIGMGHLMGFSYPTNFNLPYVARSITEFWRRWHISLSTWFRDYLYIPLGGNRLGAARTYANLLLVFLLCGLWHGANWTFAVWGLWHGFFLVLERIWLGAVLARWWRPVRHGYTLLVVMVGWVFFRTASTSDAVDFVRAMLGGGAASDILALGPYATASVLTALAVGGVCAALPAPGLRSIELHLRALIGHPAPAALMSGIGCNVVLLALLVCASATLAGGAFNPFIYFRF